MSCASDCIKNIKTIFYTVLTTCKKCAREVRGQIVTNILNYFVFLFGRYQYIAYICSVIIKQLENMTTLETTNRTFNKTVKRLITTNLNKVVAFKKVDNKCVRLIGKDGNTIALWKQTFNGSEVVLNSWY